MQRYWFGDITEDGCQTAPQDLPGLIDRVSTLRTDMEPFVPLQWSQAVECGYVPDRREYLSRLRSLCILLAGERIAAAFQRPEEEVIRMIRALDDLSIAINHLTGRCIDWHGLHHPKMVRREYPARERDLLLFLKSEEKGVLVSCVEEVERLVDLRISLARAVTRAAERAFPNSSALVGGLVAARLVERAGGLERLAVMPSATLQVLGAETALFSHLHAGTPPPKHGILFQHRRVHRAPRHLRGRVARTIAAKMAIAAKLDHLRGVLVPEFIEKAEHQIDRAGGRHAVD
jgi:nucleolar protein 56